MERKKHVQVEYRWRNGFFQHKDLDAQEIGNTLEKIREQHGMLTPEIVVESAHSKNSPAHGAFTWDDSMAGQKYRLWEARQIIRSIRIMTVEGKDEPAYIHVRRVEIQNDEEDGIGSYYQSTRVAVLNPVEWSSAISVYLLKVSQAQSALAELQKIAGTQADSNAITMLAIAAQALETAQNAAVSIRPSR